LSRELGLISFSDVVRIWSLVGLSVPGRERFRACRVAGLGRVRLGPGRVTVGVGRPVVLCVGWEADRDRVVLLAGGSAGDARVVLTAGGVAGSRVVLTAGRVAGSRVVLFAGRVAVAGTRVVLSAGRAAGIARVVLRAGWTAGFLVLRSRSTRASVKRFAIVLGLDVVDPAGQAAFRIFWSRPRISSRTWGGIFEGRTCAFLQLMAQAPIVWNLTHIGRSCFVTWWGNVGQSRQLSFRSLLEGVKKSPNRFPAGSFTDSATSSFRSCFPGASCLDFCAPDPREELSVIPEETDTAGVRVAGSTTEGTIPFRMLLKNDLTSPAIRPRNSALALPIGRLS
jgi:hypothetical protein